MLYATKPLKPTTLAVVYVNCLLATLSARNSLRSRDQSVSTAHFTTPLAYPVRNSDSDSDAAPSSRGHQGLKPKPAVLPLDFCARASDTESGGDVIVIGNGSFSSQDSGEKHTIAI